MKLSTRSRYGTKLMCDIARFSGDTPVSLREIAERQNISIKYLEQLITPLKKAGFIRSVRGPKGGYLLTKPSSEISVGEIVWLLENERELTSCISNPNSCHQIESCITRDVWAKATEALYRELNSISLQDMTLKM